MSIGELALCAREMCRCVVCVGVVLLLTIPPYSVASETLQRGLSLWWCCWVLLMVLLGFGDVVVGSVVEWWCCVCGTESS